MRPKVITNNNTLSILIVEDNRGDIALIEGYLVEYLPKPEITAVSSFSEANSILKDRKSIFDIIFLDLSLPDKSGETLIGKIISSSGGCPVVVLTGNADIEFGIKSLSLGIADYLVKDEITARSLYKSVVYNIERKRIINTVERQNSKLQEIAWIQSHLVRAPLARIMSLIDLIKNHGVSEREKSDLLDHILNSAKEFDSIIKDILKKTEQIEFNNDLHEIRSNNC
jgi:DNA-binding NtrC family response regulator